MTPILLIGFSGFAQKLAPKSDGIRDLITKINGLALPGVAAKYAYWNDDPEEVAAFVKAWRSAHPESRLVLFGHSFGGYAACRLAALLEFPIFAVALSDAVDRLDDDCTRTIIAPDNVFQVISYRREHGIPHGSPIDLADPTWTEWKDNIVEGVGHAAMSSYPPFCETVMKLALNDF